MSLVYKVFKGCKYHHSYKKALHKSCPIPMDFILISNNLSIFSALVIHFHSLIKYDFFLFHTALGLRISQNLHLIRFVSFSFLVLIILQSKLTNKIIITFISKSFFSFGFFTFIVHKQSFFF